mgnify:CR=1 FL=1
MDIALEEAKIAFEEGEVPIGAIVVKNGEIIGRGHNRRETKLDISSHAEIEAIKEAEKRLASWTLEGASLFVTVEPCLMCSGAIKQARLFALYYGTNDPTMGAVKSHYFVFDETVKDSNPLVYSGIREKECASLLKEFFLKQRSK